MLYQNTTKLLSKNEMENATKISIFHHQLLYLKIPRKNLGTDQVKEHPWVSEVKIWGGWEVGGW